jgi:hypothetical protein
LIRDIFTTSPVHLHTYTSSQDFHLLPSFYITRKIPFLNCEGIGAPDLPGPFQLHLERRSRLLHNDSSDFSGNLPPSLRTDY